MTFLNLFAAGLPPPLADVELAVGHVQLAAVVVHVKSLAVEIDNRYLLKTLVIVAASATDALAFEFDFAKTPLALTVENL